MSDIQTATTEICTNVIRHGYQTENEDRGEIRLAVVRTPETIEISITDDAPVFIPDSGSDLPLHTAAEGGYGRFLANTLMDQIRYEPLGEIGNRTTLIKRIAGESQGID